MKTIKSIMVALVLLIGTSLSATNPVEHKIKKDEAVKEIAQLLDNPTFEYEDATTAQVTLEVNAEGELVVLSVSSENSRAEDYIKSRLDHRKLQNSLEIGKTYTLPVTFKSLS